MLPGDENSGLLYSSNKNNSSQVKVFLSLSINTISVVDSILYDINATIMQFSLAENLRDKLANTAAGSRAPQSCTAG